jgi:hypothetical protein
MEKGIAIISYKMKTMQTRSQKILKGPSCEITLNTWIISGGTAN